MPNPKPEMRAFIVTVADGERVDGTDVRAPRARRIDAAYYKDEGVFTTFKDADNQQVFTARNDFLMSIERVPETPSAAGLRELLVEAEENGHAQGRIVDKVTDPDGQVYEFGYDVQVTAIASKSGV